MDLSCEDKSPTQLIEAMSAAVQSHQTKANHFPFLYSAKYWIKSQRCFGLWIYRQSLLQSTRYEFSFVFFSASPPNTVCSQPVSPSKTNVASAFAARISLSFRLNESLQKDIFIPKKLRKMCRSADYYDFGTSDQNLLRMKAFFVRFSGFDSCTEPLSDSLTLLFPPRINETARLEVSGSSIRSSSSAFVTLHRMVKVKTRDGEAIYGSRERVRAGDGVRFEVYSREEKVLKGVFRREAAEKWKMECKCALERDDGIMVCGENAVADICVAVEADAAMVERIEMVVRKCRKNRRVGFVELEDIPEEGESELNDGYCCSCGEADGGGDIDERGSGGREMDTEAAELSWAFDVGFWVMCFGVGYFVSKTTARSLRRMRIL